MLRTAQFCLYPTEAQQSALIAILDVARWLYNRALDYRRKRWNESRYSVTYDEQSAMWRDWCNEQPDDNPLRLLNMSAGQQVLRRLDKANQRRDFWHKVTFWLVATYGVIVLEDLQLHDWPRRECGCKYSRFGLGNHL
jgi:transposase